jgi:hypothetical protein
MSMLLQTALAAEGTNLNNTQISTVLERLSILMNPLKRPETEAVLVPPDHVRPLLLIGSLASPDPTLFAIGPPNFSALVD